MWILALVLPLSAEPQRAARAPAPQALAPELLVTDLELAIGYASLEEDEQLVVTAEERAQGQDLNGDGDRRDTVPYFVALASGAPLGLGVAGDFVFRERPQAFSGNVVFSFSENGQSVDYNGDGDRLDHIHHVVNLSTLRTVNLGFGTANTVGLADVAFTSTSELFEGDQNGDGDVLDFVTYHVDLVTGARERILDGLVLDVHGERLLVLDQEGGQDQNGDGDETDRFFRTYDLATSAVETRKVLLSHDASWQVLDPFVFSAPFEGELGDLNLDGDRLDRVLHVFDLEHDESVNFGRSAEPNLTRRGPWTFGFLPDTRGGAATLHVFDEQRLRLVPVVDEGLRSVAAEDAVAGSVLEAGRDRNGDGDGVDRLPALHDLRARARDLLPFALAEAPTVKYFDPVPVWLGGTAMAFVVGESEQGADLNADGDRADALLYLHSLKERATLPTGLPVEPIDDQKLGDTWLMWPGPTSFLFPISEEGQGHDLNGDGDLADAVLHVVALEDGARLRQANLGFAWQPNDSPDFYGPFVRSRWIAFLAEERSEGRDLDGDGFIGTPGAVPQFHHLPSGTTFNLGLHGFFLVVKEDVALLLVVETAHSGDLNGDGDTNDGVLFRVALVER